jgi:Zinc finger, C3HC4 type (RING finger)
VGDVFAPSIAQSFVKKKDWKNHKQQCVSIRIARDTIDNEETAMKTFLENKQSIPMLQEQISKKDNSSDDACGICLERPMLNPIILNECHHKFCALCLLKWQRY